MTTESLFFSILILFFLVLIPKLLRDLPLLFNLVCPIFMIAVFNGKIGQDAGFPPLPIFWFGGASIIIFFYILVSKTPTKKR